MECIFGQYFDHQEFAALRLLSTQSMSKYDSISDIYDELTAGYNYKEWVDIFLRAAQLESTNRLEILDIGVGTGNMAQVLAQLGHKIVGIDSSLRMIDIARSKLPEHAFYQHDMTKVHVLGSFDLVILGDDVMNHCSDFEEVSNVLEFIKINLKHSGKVALDLTSYEGYQGQFARTKLIECDLFDVIWEGRLVKEDILPTAKALLKLVIYKLKDGLYNKEIVEITQTYLPLVEFRNLAAKHAFQVTAYEINPDLSICEVKYEPNSMKYIVILKNEDT